MDKNVLLSKITAMVEPIVIEEGLELVDIEYVREKDWYLRIYINKENGIDIDDCQRVSSKVAKLLDDNDPIKEKYFLEVSSPGIDRPLKKDKDFIAFYGKQVDIQLFAAINGKKKLTGTLLSHNDKQVAISVDEQELTLDRSLVATVRPHIEF